MMMLSHRIRLFHYELDSMPRYEISLPTGTVLWKMAALVVFVWWLLWPHKRICAVCFGSNIEPDRAGPNRDFGYCWSCGKVTPTVKS